MKEASALVAGEKSGWLRRAPLADLNCPNSRNENNGSSRGYHFYSAKTTRAFPPDQLSASYFARLNPIVRRNIFVAYFPERGEIPDRQMKRRDTRAKQIDLRHNASRTGISKVETFSLLKSHHLARGIRVIPAIYAFLERDIARDHGSPFSVELICTIYPFLLEFHNCYTAILILLNEIL